MEFESENANNNSREEWSAVTKRTDSRSIAKERAERVRYAEEYRRKLEYESEIINGQREASEAQKRDYEERLARQERLREISEEKRKEAEARLAEADEKIKRLFGASMRTDSTGASANKYIFSTNDLEKEENEAEAPTNEKKYPIDEGVDTTLLEKTQRTASREEAYAEIDEEHLWETEEIKKAVKPEPFSKKRVMQEYQSSEAPDLDIDWHPVRFTSRSAENAEYPTRSDAFSDAENTLEDINYRPIERSYRGEFTERETDVAVAEAEARYSVSADDRSHNYTAEYDAHSDVDAFGAYTSYTAPRGQADPKYYHRYDSVTDVSDKDHEVATSEYGVEDSSHISYLHEKDAETFIRRQHGGYDKKMIENEHIRFLRDTEKLDRQRTDNVQKTDTGKAQKLKRSKNRSAVERSAYVVGARMEYEIEHGESELAMELLNFSAYDYNEERQRKKKAKRLSKMRRSIKRAKREEKEASLRYYLISSGLDEYGDVKREVPADKLDPIMTRLEEALIEREVINEKLAELYLGAKTKAGARRVRRGEKVRYTVAKEVHRSLKGKHRRLEKLHAPRDLKNKIRALFNKKIEAYSTLEYSRYVLRKQKPKGILKKELKGDIKRSREELRYIDKDIRALMKKAERHNTLHKDDLSWMRWLIGALIVVVALGLIWYFFGDTIKSYYS